MHDTVTDPALAGTPEGAHALRDLADAASDGRGRGPGPAGRGLAPARPPAIRGGGAAPARRGDRQDPSRGPRLEGAGRALREDRRRSRRPPSTTTSSPRAPTRTPSAARPSCAGRRSRPSSAAATRRSRCCSARWPDAPGASRRRCSSSARSRSSAESGARRRKRWTVSTATIPATAAGQGGGGAAAQARRRPAARHSPGEDRTRPQEGARPLRGRRASRRGQAVPGPPAAQAVARRTRTSFACGWAGRSSLSTRTRRPGRCWPRCARAPRWSRRPPTSSPASRVAAGHEPRRVRLRGHALSRERRGARRRCSTPPRTTRDRARTTTRCPSIAASTRATRKANTSTPRRSASGSASTAPRRFDKAAEIFEAAAKARSSNLWRPAYLYWAGRAHREMGAGGPRDGPPRGGADALQVRLSRHPGPRGAGPRARGRVVDASRAAAKGCPAIPEPYRTRVRNLLLIERLQEAMDELASAPPSPTVQATRSWIFWRQRPAPAGDHGHEARVPGVGDGERRSAARTPPGRSSSPSSSPTCSPATRPRPASIRRWWRP